MDNNMDKSADEPSTSKQKEDESHEEKRDSKEMGDIELFEQQIDMKDLFGMNMLLESGGEKPRCRAICLTLK